jgi:hypothetical protein
MKKSYLLLSTLLVMQSIHYTNCDNKAEDIALDFDAIDAILENSSPVAITATGCSPQEIVSFLNNLNIPQVLKQNFYCRTQPPVTRSPLDLPSLRTYQDPCRDLSIYMLPFYNQTSRMFLTKNSPFINCYLAFNADFLADLDIQTITQDMNLGLDDIFTLLGKIRLQERRVGVLFALYKNYRNWSLSIRTPFYYLERNFFLNEQERAEIKNAPFFKEESGTAASDDEEVQSLLMKHAGADKVGLGDTRFSAFYMFEGPCQELWLGGELTVPTAFAFKKGILLGSFCKTQRPPPFDFFDLLQLSPLCSSIPAENEELQNLIIDISLDALNHLAANVADRPLGNNGHFTLGPVFEHHYHFTDCLQLITFGGIEYLFPTEETRFFNVIKNPADFNRDFTDPEQATANLEFLNQQAIYTFFPTAICTRVSPGVIAKFSTGLLYETYHYYGMFGYDFWWQGQEHLRIYPVIPALDINKGVKPAAHQSKLFGYAGGKMYIYDYDIRLGVRGDGTIAHNGIGSDFTVGLDINVDF